MWMISLLNTVIVSITGSTDFYIVRACIHDITEPVPRGLLSYIIGFRILPTPPVCSTRTLSEPSDVTASTFSRVEISK